MNPVLIVYWTTTILVAFSMASGGVAELLRVPANVDGILHLGYPTYLVFIIGSWKVLGSIVILVPRLPRLKEWAYAGIFFNMTGAAISHAIVGEPSWHVFVTLGLALLALISWALRSNGRVIGTILPAIDRERSRALVSSSLL